MPLPLQNVIPLPSQQQLNPLATGIANSMDLYKQGVQTQYAQPTAQATLLAQILANKISQAKANLAPQMSAADLAYRQQQSQNLMATNQYITQGQLPEAQSGAALNYTNAAKNQFSLNNPGTMLHDVPQQIAEVNILKRIDPTAFGAPQVAPPTQDQNVVNNMNQGVPYRLPGMGSAGSMTSAGAGAPTLPNNPYAPPQTLGNQQQIAQTANNGYPSPDQITQTLLGSILAPAQQKIAQAQLATKQNNAFNFASLDAPVKSQMIAQARGLGLDAQQAAIDLNNGMSLPEIAKQQGYDPNNMPSPIYAGSPGAIEQVAQKSSAVAMLNELQPLMTSALKPYSRQFMDYSPALMWNQIKDSNPQQQAEALAAIQIAPEMVGARNRAMGMASGIGALKEVTERSQLSLKALQGLVSPSVFEKSQQIAEQWINQGTNASNKVVLSGRIGAQSAPTQTTSQSNAAAPQSNNVTITTKGGANWTIPRSQLKAALARGATLNNG